MRASDLVEDIPTVTRATSALAGVRLVVDRGLSALVVTGDDDEAWIVVPSSQLLWGAIPRYIRDDHALAHVYDEAGAQELWGRLATLSIAQLVDIAQVDARELPTVRHDDTTVEIALAMAASRSPVVVVRDDAGAYRGVVTTRRLLTVVSESLALGAVQDGGGSAS